MASAVTGPTAPPDKLQHLEALEKLRDAAWRSFDARRSYEWKFSVALWSALFAAAGALFSLDAKDATVLHGKSWLTWMALLVWILAVALHAWWARGCSRRDDQDRQLAFNVFEREICELVEIDFDSRVAKIFAASPSKRLNYWHTSHIALTFFLGGLVMAGALLRVNG